MKQTGKIKPPQTQIKPTSQFPAYSTTAGAATSADSSEERQELPGWFLLPLRIFLGITFAYGGIQKLTDPQYFSPHTRGYVGNQIIGFAHSSPIHWFLLSVVVPHAILFGALVAYGELAIGLATLFGILFRPAAIFGAFINLVFFLSATWQVFPYFYGSDIVFIFCWITLILAGPDNTGMSSLDSWLTSRLLRQAAPAQREKLARLLSLSLGTGETASALATVELGKSTVTSKQQASRGKQAAIKRSQELRSRRSFLWGLVTGGVGVAAVAFFVNVLRGPSNAAPVQAPTSSTPAASGTASSSSVIAQVSAVPTNSATSFTIPSNGDPGVLVHLNNGQFVAFDATCTHAGCPVQYDPSQQVLSCPCHGAVFDPAHGANVLQGPAPTPLVGVSIHVDSTTGNITLQ